MAWSAAASVARPASHGHQSATRRVMRGAKRVARGIGGLTIGAAEVAETLTCLAAECAVQGRVDADPATRGLLTRRDDRTTLREQQKVSWSFAAYCRHVKQGAKTRRARRPYPSGRFCFCHELGW